MTDNKKLIEESRTWVENLLSGNGFGDDYTAAELEQWALEMVAVFEKAHTPTDDEQAEIIRIYERCWESWNLEALPRVEGHNTFSSYLAAELSRAGLRRSEVPEPSADWRINGLVQRAQSIVNQMKSFAGRRTSPNEWCYVRFGQVESLDEVLRMMGRLSVPLDAVVEAGADELWRRATQVGTKAGPTMSECQEIMRAALRAASAVTEQGENR